MNHNLNTSRRFYPRVCTSHAYDDRLATLRAIDYRGPIGIMCYGIPGDAGEYLRRSMNVWRRWEAESTNR